MKKFLIVLFGLLISSIPVLALELDMSVDQEIQKKYNSNKLNEEVLPSLPSTLTTPSKSTEVKNQSTPKVPNNTATVVYKKGTKIQSGTKISVKSNTKVNDWLAKGSGLTFTSVNPVYTKYLTIPSGTVFRGTITDIHRPQYTGNGGLIEIKIISMNLGSKTVAVNGKITGVNGKNIFFNSIKGDRKYFISVGKQIDKGENFYNKSRKMTSKLASNPVGVIISPIPAIVGWAGYAICTVASPITGLSGKGGAVFFPAGSIFEIKLLDNAYL